MAHFWTNQGVDRKAWTPAQNARNFFLIRFAIEIILLALSIGGAYLLIANARSIPYVIVEDSEHRVYAGSPVLFKLTPDMMQAQIEDVLTVLFARTEAGPVYERPKPKTDATSTVKEPIAAIPYLNEFASPRVLHSAIDPLNQHDKMVAQNGYTQQLVVLEVKFQKVQNGAIVALVKADFRVHTDQQYAASIVYFNTRWKNIGRTEHNILGWQLNDIIVVPESYYLEDKQQQEIKANTSDANDQPDDSTPPANNTNTDSAPIQTPKTSDTTVTHTTLGNQ